MFRKHTLPILAWLFYRLISWSWRIQVHEHEKMVQLLRQKSPLILAHWHGDELAVLHLVKHYRLATMTSTSKDGAIIDLVIRRLGGDTTRGSSTRGGIGALKGLVRLLRQGRVVSVAVDGPKGPIYEVKPGVFELSRMAAAPIFPVGVWADRPYVFSKSWNKAILPRPFSKVSIVFGEPLKELSKADSPKDSSKAQELSKAIANARRQAAKPFADK